MTERIEVNGAVYRRVALAGIKEADAPRDPMSMDQAPTDWFYAWIPEARFGTEKPNSPVDQVQS